MNDKLKKCIDELDAIIEKELDLGEAICFAGESGKYGVFCNDEFVSYCGIPKSFPGALATADTDGMKIIVVNEAMLDEEVWFQEAVLAHELGHIELGHIDAIDEKVQRVTAIGSVGDFDCEADEYAVKLGTDMLGALKRLKEIGYDVDYRIKRLGR